jgi:hypothetical protein
MREARTRVGLIPDGKILMTYRLKQLEGKESFGVWKDSDPLPPYSNLPGLEHLMFIDYMPLRSGCSRPRVVWMFQTSCGGPQNRAKAENGRQDRHWAVRREAQPQTCLFSKIPTLARLTPPQP